MNTTPDETTMEKIRSAILAGQKIEAVRLHREASGRGLAESKEAVDQIEQDLRMGSLTGSTPAKKFTGTQTPWAVSAALIASLFVLGTLGVLALWSGNAADAMAQRRYTEAGSVATLVLGTLYGCVFSYSPKRRWIGHLSLLAVLLLMAAKILQILRP